MANQKLLRCIPKIDVLLAEPPLAELAEEMPYEQVRSLTRSWIEELRRRVLAGEVQEIGDVAEVAQLVAHDLRQRGRFHLKRVVNATGIVLHTNLGRAPLGDAVSAHVADVASGYSNLEYSLDEGRRGSRYAHVEKLICELTGAEAACVVNNNAGAVFLILDTLCRGEGVAISRGELVEIGGSFRVPEIMARSGARLVELGTTNKTHPEDYERALAEDDVTTLLKVHTSNFVMSGFTESVSVRELADIASRAEHRPYLIYDAGAALLVPDEVLGLSSGLSVKSALDEGADIVSFSGDKLMGSAQAGVIVGRKDLIERIKKNQLCRMLRIDKLCLAALEMTLQECMNPERAAKEVPALRMLGMTREDCRKRVHPLAEKLLKACPDLEVEELDLEDEAGGGSLPGVLLEGAGLACTLAGVSANEIEECLRHQSVPVICRVHDGAVLISGRTLLDRDDEDIVRAFAALPAPRREA